MDFTELQNSILEFLKKKNLYLCVTVYMCYMFTCICVSWCIYVICAHVCAGTHVYVGACACM